MICDDCGYHIKSGVAGPKCSSCLAYPGWRWEWESVRRKLAYDKGRERLARVERKRQQAQIIAQARDRFWADLPYPKLAEDAA